MELLTPLSLSECLSQPCSPPALGHGCSALLSNRVAAGTDTRDELFLRAGPRGGCCLSCDLSPTSPHGRGEWKGGWEWSCFDAGSSVGNGWELPSSNGNKAKRVWWGRRGAAGKGTPFPVSLMQSWIPTGIRKVMPVREVDQAFAH